MARFPDFLCVGQQKAGTTWLWRNLRDHPDVYCPFVKEVDYFNDLYIPEHRSWISRTRRLREFLAGRERVADEDADAFEDLARFARFAPNDAWYASMFEPAGERVTGDLTPGYALLPEVGLWHARRLNPQARVLVLVRDPVERSWSAVRHYLRADDASLDTVDLIDFIEQRPDILAYSDAATIVARWRSIFPAEQVSVFRHSEISNAPEQVLASVCDLIGVDAGFAFPRARTPIFEGEEADMTDDVRAFLSDKLAGAYEGLAQLFPTAA